MKKQTIPITAEELKKFVIHAAKAGAIEACKLMHKQIISKQTAHQIYGKTLIDQLEQIGIISPHTVPLKKNVLRRYNIIEIEAALTAVQIDESMADFMRGKGKNTNRERHIHEDNMAYGLKELAEAYCCSYSNAKILRRKVAAACVKDGRHIVIDLKKANEIVPMPPLRILKQS